MTATAIALCATRMVQRRGAHQKYAATIAGMRGTAASIFAVIAVPASVAARTSHRRRPVWTALIVVMAPAVMRKTNMASVLLEWLTTTLIGISARASAANAPALRPHTVRTPKYSSTTAAVPAIACGSNKLICEYPKIFADNACIHNENGGLSTATKPPGSKLAYRKLCQLIVMLRTAAA